MSDEPIDQESLNEAVAARMAAMDEGLDTPARDWEKLTSALSGATRQGPQRSDVENADVGDAQGKATEKVLMVDPNTGQIMDRGMMSTSNLQRARIGRKEGEPFLMSLPQVSTQEEMDALTPEQRKMVEAWVSLEKADAKEAARMEAEPLSLPAGMGMDLLAAVPGAAPLTSMLLSDDATYGGYDLDVTNLQLSYQAYEDEYPIISALTYGAGQFGPALFTGGAKAASVVLRGGIKKVADEAAAGAVTQSMLTTNKLAELRKAAPYFLGVGPEIAAERALKGMIPTAVAESAPILTRSAVGAVAGGLGAMRENMTISAMRDHTELSVENVLANGVVGGVFGVLGENAATMLSNRFNRKNAEYIADHNNGVMAALFKDLNLEANDHAFLEYMSNPDNMGELFERMEDLMRVTDEEVAQVPFGTKMLNVVRSLMSGFSVRPGVLNRMSTEKFRAGLQFANENLGKGESPVMAALADALENLRSGQGMLRRVDELATGQASLTPEAEAKMAQVTDADGNETGRVMTPEERQARLLDDEQGVSVQTRVGSNEEQLVNTNYRGVMLQLASELDGGIVPGDTHGLQPKQVADMTQFIFGVPLGVRRMRVGVEQLADGTARLDSEWQWARVNPGDAAEGVEAGVAPLGGEPPIKPPDYDSWEVMSVSEDLEKHLTEIDAGKLTLEPERPAKLTTEDVLGQTEGETADLLAAIDILENSYKLKEVMAPEKTVTPGKPSKPVPFEGRDKARGNLVALADGQARGEPASNLKGVTGKLVKEAQGGQIASSGGYWLKRFDAAGSPEEFAPLADAFKAWNEARGDLGKLVNQGGDLRDAKTKALDRSTQSTARWKVSLENLGKAEAALQEALSKYDMAFPGMTPPAPAAKSLEAPAVLAKLRKAVEGGFTGDYKKIVTADVAGSLEDLLTTPLRGADAGAARNIAEAQDLLNDALREYGLALQRVNPALLPEVLVAKAGFGGKDPTFLSAYKELRDLAKTDQLTAGRQFNVLQNAKKRIYQMTKDDKTFGRFMTPGLTALQQLKGLTENTQLWGNDWGLGQAQINQAWSSLIDDSVALDRLLREYGSADTAPIDLLKQKLFGQSGELPNTRFPRVLMKMIADISQLRQGARSHGIGDDAIYRALAGEDGRRVTSAQAAIQGEKRFQNYQLLLENAIQLQNALQSTAELSQAFGEQWRNAGLVRNGAPGWVRLPAMWGEPTNIVNRGARYLDGIAQQYVMRPISAESYLAHIRGAIMANRTKEVKRVGAFKRFVRKVGGGENVRHRSMQTALKNSLPIGFAKFWVGSDEEVEEVYVEMKKRVDFALEGTAGEGATIANGMSVQGLDALAENFAAPFLTTPFAQAGNVATRSLVTAIMDMVDRMPGMKIPGLPSSQQPNPHPSEMRSWLKLFAAISEGPSICLPLMEAGMLDPDVAQFTAQHFPLLTGQLMGAFSEEIQSGKFPYDLLLQFENWTGRSLTPTATPSAILAFQQANQGANTPAAAAATGMQRRGQVRMAGLSATDNELRQRRHERQGRA